MQVAFPAVPPVLSYVQSGKLRALGVTGTGRALPDVPPIADPALKTRFVALGAEPAPMRSAQLGALMVNAAAKCDRLRRDQDELTH